MLADELGEMEKDKPIGNALSTPLSWNEIFDAIADTYNGFVFWSMLTSLGLVVWYFPLWHMGISGFEAFVMSTVSPYLLGIGPLRSFVIRNIRLVHLLSICGLVSYLITAPALRLLAVGFGVSMSCLGWSALWFAERGSSSRLENRAVGWTAGLIASGVAKFAFQTNNPIWPIMHGPNGGWNKLGIVLAILAAVRSTRGANASEAGFDPVSKPSGSALRASLGLAGLLFGLHSFLSDSSTMILWVWEGFPVRGPIAVHGVLTIFAMVAGLCSSFYYRETISPSVRLLIAAIGAFLVTATNFWTGFLGALGVAFGFTSLVIPLIVSAVRYSPATTFGTGFLIYNIMVLAHVWVVAYAFVPGGPIMREHTDWVVTATVVMLGLGVLNLPEAGGSTKGRWKQHNFGRMKSPYYVYILAAIQLLAVSISYLRFPTNNYKPYHAEDKVITAGIWTIHFSLDNDMWSSEYRMRDVLKELELDVIGLLESDNQRIIMGNRDQTQFLAEELGMYVDYGPGPDKHTWGSALLSKFPILNSTHHLLPSPVGELAPAIHATIEAYGHPVDVFVFHSGQEEDPEDRRLQSEYLAKLMRETPRPSILLSYLVIKPGEGNYHTYVGEKSGMKDIDPSDWDRWCEYILYKGLKRSGYARVSRSTITDTEIQVGSAYLQTVFTSLTRFRLASSLLESQREVTNISPSLKWLRDNVFPCFLEAKACADTDTMYSTSLDTLPEQSSYENDLSLGFQ